MSSSDIVVQTLELDIRDGGEGVLMKGVALQKYEEIIGPLCYFTPHIFYGDCLIHIFR